MNDATNHTYSDETINNSLGLTASEFTWCMNLRNWNDELIKCASEIQKLKTDLEKYKGKPLANEIQKQIDIRRRRIGESLDAIKSWTFQNPDKISIQL